MLSLGVGQRIYLGSGLLQGRDGVLGDGVAAGAAQMLAGLGHGGLHNAFQAGGQGPAAGQGRAGAQGGDQQVLQIPPGETLGGENAGGGAPGFLEQTQQQVFAAYVIMSQALGQGPGGS